MLLPRALLPLLLLPSPSSGGTPRDDFIRAYHADSKGDFAAAHALYQQVLDSGHPNCDECHWNMALGTQKRGREREAQHHYRHVIRILQDGALGKALLQKTLQPSHLATAKSNLAGMLMQSGQETRARELLEEVLEADPAHSQASGALLQLEAGRSAAAQRGGGGAPPPRPAPSSRTQSA